MLRQAPSRWLRVIALTVAGAGMLATAALAATSTPPNGGYGKLPARGGYGGYGGYGSYGGYYGGSPGRIDDGSARDGGQKPDETKKEKKNKKSKGEDKQVKQAKDGQSVAKTTG